MGAGLNFFTNAVNKTPATKGSWQDVDVSGDGVPSGSSGVILELRGTAGGGNYLNLKVRKNGSTFNPDYCRLDNDYVGGYAFVGIDANRIFEAYVDTGVEIWLVGYTGSDVVYFDNPSDENPSSTGSWLDVDKSGSIPSGATGIIVLTINGSGSNYQRSGIRKNGSSDEWPYGASATGYSAEKWMYCALDANRVYEVKVQHADITVFTMAYTKGEVVFLSSPIENSPASASAWTDVDVTAQTSATADGVLLMAKNNAAYNNVQANVRKNGSTDNRTTGHLFRQGGGDTTGAAVGMAMGLDSGQIYETWIGDATYIDIYVVGYNQPAGGPTNISVSDSGLGAEVTGKIRNLATIPDSGSGSETLGKQRNVAPITDAGTGAEAFAKERQLAPILDSGLGSELLSKLRQLGIISDTATGSELMEKARLMSILDSALGSELVSRLRNVAIIIDSGLGSEAILTPNRDIIVLDSGSGAEILAKLRQLGVITDSGSGSEGITQSVLIVGLGPYIIVLNEWSGGISLSTSLRKNISLDVSRPMIALRVNPDAN